MPAPTHAGSGLSLPRSGFSPATISRGDISLDAIGREAERTIHALPPMTLPAAHFSHVTAQGIHGRRKAGPGDVFWQFRPYHTGDPASLIDWRRSARSDLNYVRQNEWESAQDVWLWVDFSESMLFRSDPGRASKLECAMVLALAAAMLLTAGGEKIGYPGLMPKTAGGAFALARLSEALDLARFSSGPALPAAEGLGSRAHLIAVGDFLKPEADLKRGIAALRGQGIVGHMIHVVDPAEEDFPYRGRIRFSGLEGEGSETIERAEEVRPRYRARAQDWRRALSERVRAAGWTYTFHRTDQPAHLALVGLLGALERLRETPDRAASQVIR